MDEKVITNEFLINYLDKLSEREWQSISSTEFKKNIIEPLNMIGEDRQKIISCSIGENAFKNFSKRLWKEQHIEPSENPDEYEDAYYETLPIVILLERITRARLPLAPTTKERNEMMQQLSALKLILNPASLDGMVKVIKDDDKIVGYSSVRDGRDCDEYSTESTD